MFTQMRSFWVIVRLINILSSIKNFDRIYQNQQVNESCSNMTFNKKNVKLFLLQILINGLSNIISVCKCSCFCLLDSPKKYTFHKTSNFKVIARFIDVSTLRHKMFETLNHPNISIFHAWSNVFPTICTTTPKIAM